MTNGEVRALAFTNRLRRASFIIFLPCVNILHQSHVIHKYFPLADGARFEECLSNRFCTHVQGRLRRDEMSPSHRARNFKEKKFRCPFNSSKPCAEQAWHSS